MMTSDAKGRYIMALLAFLLCRLFVPNTPTNEQAAPRIPIRGRYEYHVVMNMQNVDIMTPAPMAFTNLSILHDVSPLVSNS